MTLNDYTAAVTAILDSNLSDSEKMSAIEALRDAYNALCVA